MADFEIAVDLLGRRFRKNWKVTKSGMECDGYYIAADRYNEIFPGYDDWCCSDWLFHIANKGSFDIDAFIEAFAFAMKKAGIEPTFDWDRSVEKARSIAAHADRFEQIWRELYPTKGPELINGPELMRRWDEVNAEMRRRQS